MITEDAEQYYRIPDWGTGFFYGGDNGHLWLTPTKNRTTRMDLYLLVQKLKEQGAATPLKFHFPQMLNYSISKLTTSFSRAAKEFNYLGGYAPIYPIKANPAFPVVKAILSTGEPNKIGLEAGSIPELAAVMSVAKEKTPIVCNGYKDETYMRLVLVAAGKIKRVFLVIEKFSELEIFVSLIKKINPKQLPFLGIRARLHTKGTGKWEESGGDFAKFGLTASEIVEAVAFLKKHGLLNRLVMLHTHIGSQITHSRKIKAMTEETGMIYAELFRMGVPIKIVDFGGGLGVDYDGSRSSGAFSINYTVTEYANNLIFHMKGVCDQQEVPEPELFTESGRAITAYHSMIVVDVVEKHSLFQAMPVKESMEREDKLLVDLMETYELLNTRNLVEYFHDAIHMKEQLHTLFNIGVLTLKQKAVGERIFWNIVRKVAVLAPRMDHRPEELETLDSLLASKYVTNFSIFRSVPDAWAIRQIFPIAPIHRLREVPGESAVLADITCDSDGKITRFADISSTRETLKFHRLKNEPYYLGIFLTGAYQDAMGNAHNLFGTPDTFFVEITGDNRFQILRHEKGDTVGDMLKQNGYDLEQFQNKWGFEHTITDSLGKTTYLHRVPSGLPEQKTQPFTLLLQIMEMNCSRCRSDVRAILSDLPMISDFKIENNIVRLTIAGSELIPHLESILKEAGFSTKIKTPDEK